MSDNFYDIEPTICLPAEIFQDGDYQNNLAVLNIEETEFMDEIFENEVVGEANDSGPCCLNITEQPVEKFRFRYKSEMNGSHGALTGENSGRTKKTYPSVELCGYNGKAIVRCSLVQVNTLQANPSPHPHRLVVRKNDVDIDDPHDVDVDVMTGYLVEFKGMGIIHTAKSYVEEVLVNKLTAIRKAELGIAADVGLTNSETDKLKARVKKERGKLNLNQVCLCFQAFDNNDGELRSLCSPVYSNTISNLKSAITGELKITRLSIVSGSPTGNEDLILLVEKVSKANIKVRFFELETNLDGSESDTRIWEEFGQFTEADVHHQYAICLRTPRYRNLEINERVKVYIELIRTNDNEKSEPRSFTYVPIKSADRKRMRLHHHKELMNFDEFRKVKKNDDSDNLLDNLVTDGIDETLATQSTMDTVIEEIKTISSNGKIVDKQEINDLIERNKTSNDENILHWAVQSDNFDQVKYVLLLIEKFYLNYLLNAKTRASQETCLHLACGNDKPGLIKAFIKLGADPNMLDADGNTPLQVAIKYNNEKCIKILLDLSKRGCQTLTIDSRNYSGRTALHMAVWNSEPNIVEELVKANASLISRESSQGYHILHIAVKKRNIKMVKYILQYVDGKVDPVDFSGQSTVKFAYAEYQNLAAADTQERKNALEIFNTLKKHFGVDYPNMDLSESVEEDCMDLSESIDGDSTDTD